MSFDVCACRPQRPAVAGTGLALQRGHLFATTALIAVVIPAHNEAAVIAQCLESVVAAGRCARLHGEAVQVVVVLDACTDDTAGIARLHGASLLAVNARNVGAARAAGAALALNAGARWLAFTDADTTVAPDWLSTQLALGRDAVCGTVGVRSWRGRSAHLRRRYTADYVDADGHCHVHGANLGVSADAYRRAGGFPPLATSEDVALVQALKDSGASIAWSSAPRVVTSARHDHRAPGGFGATLARMEALPGLRLAAAE